MLKLKFRVLFLLLGVIILLFAFVGCNYTNDDPSNTTADTTTSNPEEEQPPKLVSLRADPYFQGALSWEYSLDVKVEDEKIYINDTLYKESSSVPPIILYSEGFLAGADFADKMNNDNEITNTLTKIQNGKPFCVLETDQDSSCGKLLSVYEINGAYYFIRFYDNGDVMRIHSATIE